MQDGDGVRCEFSRRRVREMLRNPAHSPISRASRAAGVSRFDNSGLSVFDRTRRFLGTLFPPEDPGDTWRAYHEPG
jgi:hypothetical protein